MNEKRFNVRVYGIVINDRKELLVSDELIRGVQFTKFPGGGLEWGEGTMDCLRREFMEELHQPIEVISHYYTTDFFQASAFRDTDQLLSIYYRARLIGPIQFEVKSRPFDFPDSIGNQLEVQRWIPMAELRIDDFRWPVDRHVAEKLIEEYQG